MRYVTLVVFIVMISGFGPRSAWARVTLQPTFSLLQEYTDNLFLTDRNPTDDWLTLVEPGIGMTVVGPLLDADIDYSLRLRYYHELTEENQTNLRDAQRASALIQLQPSRDLSVLIDGDIDRVTIDTRDPGVDESELVNSTNQYHLAITPQYRWTISNDNSLTLSYRNERFLYRAQAGDDVKSHEWRAIYAYDVTAATTWNLTYAYLFHFAEVNMDFEKQLINAGLTHRISPRFRLAIEGGPVTIEYFDETEESWTRWDVLTDYTLSRKTSVYLSYEQDTELSVDRGLSRIQIVTLNVVYEGNARIDAELFWDEEIFSEDRTEDRAIGTSLMMRVPLSGRYFTEIIGLYRTLEFLPANEKTDRYSVRGALGYTLSTGTLMCGYMYRVNRSTVEENDYRNNLYTLSAQLRF